MVVRSERKRSGRNGVGRECRGVSSGDLSLIGVDGPDVGVLFPEPLDFFDFEVGDVISYVLSEVDVSMWPPDTDWIQYRNMIITSRTEFAGGRMYGYDLDIDYSNGIGLQLPAWLGPDLTGNWTITEAMLFEHHRMLFTYPGEVVGATCFGTTGTDQSWGSVLAEWRIDQEGTGSVSNGTIPEYPCQGEGVQMISPYEIQPRLFALELEACMAACYIEGVGPSVLNLPGSGHSCYLTGSFSHVGNDELSEHVSLEPYPNPANDYLWITGSLPGNSISITDIQGRVVIVQPVTSANERKNVQALPSGVYVLMMEGVRPQRFVVSR